MVTPDHQPVMTSESESEQAPSQSNESAAYKGLQRALAKKDQEIAALRAQIATPEPRREDPGYGDINDANAYASDASDDDDDEEVTTFIAPTSPRRAPAPRLSEEESIKAGLRSAAKDFAEKYGITPPAGGRSF